MAIASSFSDNKKDDDRPRRWRYADLYAAISPPRQAFADEVGITSRSAYSCLCRRRHNHDFRHTFVSLARRGGVPLEVISRLVTHRSVTTTADVYSQLELEDLRAELDAAGLLDPVAELVG